MTTSQALTKNGKTIAVLGARGRLGHQVVLAFRDAGWNVWAVVRPESSSDLPEGVERIEADALNRLSLEEACAGADVVFNGLNPPYSKWHTEASALAENVVAAAQCSGATHLFPGNVYNFGRSIPERCTPETPFDGREVRKAAIRIAMESRFQQAAEEGVQTIILRAGDFYGGPQTGSWMDLVLLSKLDKGVFTYPAGLDVLHAWAYLPDLAQAFLRLAESRSDLSRFEHFCFAGHTLTGAVLHSLVQTAQGRELKRKSLFWPGLKFAGLFSPTLREVLEMRYLWERPHALVDPRLDSLVGPLASTRPDRAVSDALEALGHKPVA